VRSDARPHCAITGSPPDHQHAKLAGALVLDHGRARRAGERIERGPRGVVDRYAVHGEHEIAVAAAGFVDRASGADAVHLHADHAAVALVRDDAGRPVEIGEVGERFPRRRRETAGLDEEGDAAAREALQPRDEDLGIVALPAGVGEERRDRGDGRPRGIRGARRVREGRGEGGRGRGRHRAARDGRRRRAVRTRRA
jgi:hypothetical protein